MGATAVVVSFETSHAQPANPEQSALLDEETFSPAQPAASLSSQNSLIASQPASFAESAKKVTSFKPVISNPHLLKQELLQVFATSGAELLMPAGQRVPASSQSEVRQLSNSMPALTAPQVAQTPQFLAQELTFSDVRDHWAQSFIEALAAQDIIRGFPDGTFRPEAPVTRAQFAALIRKAFARNSVRNPIQFADVPANYWAYDAIQEAYSIGFLEGYPNNVFAPDQKIPRVEVLVSLANGLNLAKTGETTTILSGSFQDASSIPNYAQNSIAVATENQLIVNYPNVQNLNPNQVATRADVAAFIYQALANTGALPQLSVSDKASQYIVGYEPPQTPPPPITSSSAGDAPNLTPQPIVPGREQFVPERIPLRPVANTSQRQKLLASPGTTSVTPSAYGKSWRSVGVGAGFQARTRFTDESDGGIAVGFGLGNAQKAVGLDVGAAIFNLSDSFGDRGGVSFKLHRALPDDFAVAIGWQNAIVWGFTDAGSSVYGVASKMFRLQDSTEKPFSRLYLSAGVGNGQFRSEFDINDNKDTIGVFGSVAVRVAQPVNAIAEWTGQDLTLGVSFVPFQNVPLVITPAVTDVTNNAGDGARFILGIGYGFYFR
ncbi:S-layer homology domain-containing protein [Microcoleus sp. FACHB-672]|uniref:S-layer homology domain-containing protein n=1 Tax=Microcoleus sp. FACHB-672 TaxID=2692825 RepID=UPI001F554579|nr:S-layer homology domain-containing protein [Microcoleus sp. FACHB-672]